MANVAPQIDPNLTNLTHNGQATEGTNGATEGGTEGDMNLGTLLDQLATYRANPKKRPRTKETPTRDAAAEEDEGFRRVDRITRFDALLFCSNFRYHAIILEAFGPDVDPDGYTYDRAYNLILDHVKYYKSQTLKKMKAHVTKVLEEHPTMQNLRNVQSLAAKFKGLYTIDTFLSIWYWIAPYIDMQQSSDLARFFCESLYINLAVEIKVEIDAELAGQGVADAHEKVLEFYDDMPLHRDLAGMCKAEFHEITSHSKGRKIKKVKKTRKALERFQSIGIPPPPRSAQNAASPGS